MPLARKDSIKQLNKVRKACDKKGVMGKGDIGSKSDGDLKGANVLYVHEVPSKMKVDTWEDFTSPKGEGRKTQKHMQKLKINASEKNNNNNMKNLVTFNEHSNSRDILTPGRQISFGKVDGYINMIEGNSVWIEMLDGTGIQKFNLIDVVKKIKINE